MKKSYKPLALLISSSLLAATTWTVTAQAASPSYKSNTQSAKKTWNKAKPKSGKQQFPGIMWKGNKKLDKKQFPGEMWKGRTKTNPKQFPGGMWKPKQ